MRKHEEAKKRKQEDAAKKKQGDNAAKKQGKKKMTQWKFQYLSLRHCVRAMLFVQNRQPYRDISPTIKMNLEDWCLSGLQKPIDSKKPSFP